MAERRQPGSYRSERVWRPYGDARSEGFQEDPYDVPERLPEPSTCEDCGACYHDGRWTWDIPGPGEANMVVCPACQRIRDDYAGGELELSGDFLAEHRDEIDGLIKNAEAAETAEHPLHRIMQIREQDDGHLLIRTTDIHLPRRIGEALNSAYEGEFDFQYLPGEQRIRASWSR